MDRTHLRRFTTAAAYALAISLAGCGDDDPTGPGAGGPAIPPPTTPEHLVESIEIIYNDGDADALARLQAYASLFPLPLGTLPGFVFRLQPDDVANGLPASWGRDEEFAIHQAMFGAQSAGQIFSLSASIEQLPPAPLVFPDPGQEDWRSIAAIDVNLRLLFNPDDGLEVRGGQAEFILAPADSRWYLVEWRDLPRAGVALPGAEVEPATWGAIKSRYYR